MTVFPTPPVALRPRDGRFGAGPSLIRRPQVETVAAAAELGTSHRQDPVKRRVQSIQEGLRSLFSLPSAYEIVLGVGGATAFWAVTTVSLVESRAKAAVFGEFGSKFAADVAAAPWAHVKAVEALPGKIATIEDDVAEADTYIYAQNETSTAVMSPLYRGAPSPALTVVDATSIAGAVEVDWDLVDVYFFSPQKCFGSEGGLWIAALSPDAVSRAQRLCVQTDRYVPSFLNLADAINQSRGHQTLNTPAIASLVMLDEQIKWMSDQGGLAAMSQKARRGADLIGAWASQRPYAAPFVADPLLRSPTVTTVDLDPSINATAVAHSLRRAGIVDIEGYRKLGRNQLRIASFPSIDTADIEALLTCLDWVIDPAWSLEHP